MQPSYKVNKRRKQSIAVPFKQRQAPPVSGAEVDVCGHGIYLQIKNKLYH